MQNDQHGCALCTSTRPGLKLCQLAERPIQKNFPVFPIPKIITHSILPQTHTLQTWQLLKETRACPCTSTLVSEWGRGSGRGLPRPRASCPPDSHASAIASKPHRMVVNILYGKKINTSSNEPRSRQRPTHTHDSSEKSWR